MMHSKNTGQTLDLDTALVHVDGDPQLLAELAVLFIQDYPRLREEARESILKGDCASLERAAHTLKGRLAFFGIFKGREQTLALEMMGRNHDLSGAEQVLADIDMEMESVLIEMEPLSRVQNS
jgi:two-component system, sensor histidine kinase and response regulator